MNILPLAAPSITPVRLSALAGVAASAALNDSLAASTLSGVAGNASVVDLSGLGQLLSTVAAFQASQALAGFSNDAIGQDANAEASFGNPVPTAELFVGAVNNFQAGNVDSVQNLFGAPFDNALLSALNAPLALSNGKTLLAGLAQIGINFQGATSLPGSTGQFTLDLQTLQSAFSADPSETSSVLTQAFQALGQAAATIVSQNVNLFSTDSISALLGNVPSSPFDMMTVAGAMAPLNTADAAAVNAALQSLLNEQALNTAFVENATAAQPVVAANQETSARSGDNLVAISPMSPLAGTNALVASAVGGNAVAENQTGTVGQGVNPAIVPQASTVISGAQSTSLLDPSIAAAVAAYRLGDAVLGTKTNDAAIPSVEPVSDIVEVTRIKPTTFDPNDDAGNGQRNEDARNALHLAVQRNAPGASKGLLSY